MSSGKVHADTTVAAGGVVGPALYYLGHVPQAAIVSFTGVCMVGLVINPDLYMRHRHLLSHFPLVGTAGRVLYLLAALALLWFAAGLLPLPALSWPSPDSTLWWGLSSLVLVDAI